MPYYAGAATVTVGLWAKKAGTWSKIANQNHYVTGTDGSATSTGRVFSGVVTVPAGTNVESFGVTIEGVENGSSATLNAFSSVAWVSTTVSGARTATPSSQKGRITVRPQ